MKNRSIYLIASAIALLSLVSCQKDGLRENDRKNNVLRFDTTVPSNETTTKAQVSYDAVLTDKDESVKVELTCDVVDGIVEKSGNNGFETKGALINTSGSTQALPSDKSFFVSAWTGTTKDFGPQEVKHRNDVKGGEYWITVDEDDKDKEYIWHKDETKLFYAYANPPTSGATITNTDNTSQTLSYTVPSTATAQTDILLGHYKGKGDNGTATITFQHPLTAVQFIKGTMQGNPVIKRISITGVAKSGSISMDEDGTLSTWSGVSDYTGVVYQDIPSDNQGLLEEPFLLIPQSPATHHVILTLTLEEDVELTAEIATETWEAGKTNKYTIGFKNNELIVEGDVAMNYDATEGPHTYDVTCNSGTTWALEYTTDGGEHWTAAAANTLIDDWIKFDKVSGEGNDAPTRVTATVTAANSSRDFELDHVAELKDAPAKGTKSNPYDLSMHKVNGAPQTGHTTANCYVISSRGWYAFPLVYGNALKDGVANTQAYKPTKVGSADELFLTPFIDANENGINSPFISGVADVFPLWEDVPDFGLIRKNDTDSTCIVISQSVAEEKGLTCECPYVMFNIDGETIKQGNVLLAVKDASNKILWSWHIWVTDNDLSTIPVGGLGNTVAMMPLSLGAVDIENSTTVNGYPKVTLQIRFVQKKGGKTKSTVQKIAMRKPHTLTPSESSFFSCPTYQWGRKDPFIRNNNINNEELPPESKSIYAGYDAVNTFVGPVTVAYTIANPNTFITYNGETATRGANWSNKRYYNLFSAKAESCGTTAEGYSTTPVKTIYDPCPPGYQVPQGNFTCNALDLNQKGGSRRSSNGTIFNVKGTTNYRTAILEAGSGDDNGASSFMAPGYEKGGSSYRVVCYGELIRPVIEP